MKVPIRKAGQGNNLVAIQRAKQAPSILNPVCQWVTHRKSLRNVPLSSTKNGGEQSNLEVEDALVVRRNVQSQGWHVVAPIGL